MTDETLRNLFGAAWKHLAIACLGSAAALAAGPPSHFYEGKQITVIVGNPAGSGYDAYARLLTRHMGKYIPGNPTFIVQNMPGAGSINAAQHLANVAAKDGTAFGILVPGAIFDPLLDGQAKFRYSPFKFEYLGSADSGTRLCFTSKKSGVATIEDARKNKVVLASTAPQSSATDYALFMNALAGTKFDIVLGYKGPADLLLAMERGEAAGICALNSATVNSIRPDWLENGSINILAQAGLEPNPHIKGPSIFEFISAENRPVAELIVSQQEFSRPFMAPPGTPPEQLETLRTAFMAAMKDPELWRKPTRCASASTRKAARKSRPSCASSTPRPPNSSSACARSCGPERAPRSAGAARQRRIEHRHLIPDLGEQFDVGGQFRRRRSFDLGLFLAHQFVHRPNDKEQHKRHDGEVQGDGQELPVADHRALLLGVGVASPV